MILPALLIVTVGFGFLKQIKRLPSADAFLTVRPDVGAPARLLRDEARRLRPVREPLEPAASYVTDRSGGPGHREASQFFQDCQYAFAPDLLETGSGSSGPWLLDFTSPVRAAEYVRTRGWAPAAREGGLILAVASEERAG